MVDGLGILEFVVSRHGNGCIIYNDGSIGVGYKIPGIKFFTMTPEEQELSYEIIRNVINNVDIGVYNPKSQYYSLYQIISQPNYDFKYLEKELEMYNNIDKDKTLPNPEFYKRLFEKNNKDTIKNYEYFGSVDYDNYIFVRIYPNYQLYGYEKINFLKEIILSQEPEHQQNMKNLYEVIDSAIATHNSKFKALGGTILNMLESINVIRKFFGYSKLKNIPNLIDNDDSHYKLLFPGLIEFQNDKVITQENFVLDKEIEDVMLSTDKKYIDKIELLRNEEKSYFDYLGNEYKLLCNDLDYIYKDILKIDYIEVNKTKAYDKYIWLKQNLPILLRKVNVNTILKNCAYFTKDKFETYLLEHKVSEKFILQNNKTQLSVLSLNELPGNLKLFHGWNYHSLPGDYSIVINFRRLDSSGAQLKMRRQVIIERIKMDMPIMKWFLPIESMQEKVASLQDLITNLDREDWSRCEMTNYIVFRTHEEHEERLKDIGGFENQIQMKFNFEKDATPYHILNGATPFSVNKSCFSYSKRNLLVNSTNVAQLSPIFSEENGSTKPLMTFQGYTKPIKLDLNEAPAGHFSIAGGTGGGKSYIAQKILCQMKMNNEKCIFTEKGFSSERTTLFFGGKVYKPDMSGTIKLNPFIMPIRYWNDDEVRQSSYVQMISAMSQMCDNYTPSVQNKYYKILKTMFEKDGKPNAQFITQNGSITPSKILNFMKGYYANELDKEINSFEQYTASGIYGKLFDGNEGIDLNYPVISIDYSQLQDPNIKDFIFKSLMNNIFSILSLDTNTTRFTNINDEFWDVISTAGMLAKDGATNTALTQIEHFFRVARKLGGKIGVVSQGISDIQNSPLASAVLNNIFHSFFTRTDKKTELEVIRNIFNLEDSQLKEIEQLSQVKGEYSEYFVSAPYGEKPMNSNTIRKYNTKFKYMSTPLETALFTTYKPEIEIFNMLYTELNASGKSHTVSQEIVMKAVRIFTDILPKGISDKTIEEQIVMNGGDHIYTIKKIIDQKFGSALKAADKLSWQQYIDMA